MDHVHLVGVQGAEQDLEQFRYVNSCAMVNEQPYKVKYVVELTPWLMAHVHLVGVQGAEQDLE